MTPSLGGVIIEHTFDGDVTPSDGNLLTSWTANVCQALADIRSSLEAYAGCFSAVALGPGEPDAVLEHAAAIESMAATVKSLCAAFLADVGGFRGGGRSDAENLARQMGTTTGAARDAIETGRRLEALPEVAHKARAGELSATQASMIANAGEANPARLDELLARAESSSVAELREHCARAKAEADPDPDERHRRIHAGRGLRAHVDLEGCWRLYAQGTPDQGAQVMAALGPLADRLFHEAREAGRKEAPAAYAFDALVELAMGATSGSDATEPADPSRRRKGAPVKLLVRIDWTALLRGVAADGEVCELVGYGPLPVSVIQAIISYGDPFVAAVITKGEALIGAAHLGRKPTRLQETALQWLYPTCAAEGCTQQVRLQIDHRIDWAKIHLTVFEWLDRLCPFHHGLKTRENWLLVDGIGKRPFVSPDDARHPSHKRRAEAV